LFINLETASTVKVKVPDMKCVITTKDV